MNLVRRIMFKKKLISARRKNTLKNLQKQFD